MMLKMMMRMKKKKLFALAVWYGKSLVSYKNYVMIKTGNTKYGYSYKTRLVLICEYLGIEE